MCFLLFKTAFGIVKGWQGKQDQPYAVILYYHAIRKEHQKSFSWQLDTLLKWALPISADPMKKLSHGKRYVAITFDDGFICVNQYALPELIQRSIPATLFVPTGLFGKNPPWLEHTLHSDKNEVIATAEQIAETSRLPGITIGSHCVNHCDLLTLSDEVSFHEIMQSKTDLEKITGKSIYLLSFPHGNYNENHIRMAREAQYRKVFTILPTRAFIMKEEFIVGRVAAYPNDWKIEFWLKIMGGYLWLPKSYAIKRRIRLLASLFNNK
jgi:peptidoglycan/xylan/chitin deacetylase (PgdA/CDA1 family)